tara:strand:- start:2838 stop:3140 length:303 start_codon:yes stop_codon:yes gene_type:complete
MCKLLSFSKWTYTFLEGLYSYIANTIDFYDSSGTVEKCCKVTYPTGFDSKLDSVFFSRCIKKIGSQTSTSVVILMFDFINFAMKYISHFNPISKFIFNNL